MSDPVTKLASCGCRLTYDGGHTMTVLLCPACQAALCKLRGINRFLESKCPKCPKCGSTVTDCRRPPDYHANGLLYCHCQTCGKHWTEPCIEKTPHE